MNPGKFVVGLAALLVLGPAIPARAQIAGFGTNGTNWSLNNDPASQSVPFITNNVLLLATNINTANSAFYDTPQNIGSFTASFVFQNLQANDGEGFVFALQNQGTNAVSTVGGNYLGYYGLSEATGIAFDISPRAGEGLGYAPTQVPSGGPGGYIPTGGVNFRGTNAIAANISYSYGVVTVTVTDMITGSNFTTNFVENLVEDVGGSTAYVGFTGGGTAILNLEITNFVFTPGSQTPVTSKFPVTLNPAGNIDVTKLKGDETDGVIAYDPLIPAELFIAADTNALAVQPGLIGMLSFNGGSNWGQISLAGLPAGSQPAVAWDGYGNLFLAYADGTPTLGIDVAVSTNGGINFSLLTNLATGDSTVLPRIAVGAGAGLGSVWVLYQDFSLSYFPLVAQGAAVTNLGTNGVGAFGPVEFVPEPPTADYDCGFGDIAVGPQGQVMVAYQNLFNSTGQATCYVSVDPDGLGPGGFNPPVVAAQNAIGGQTHIPATPNGLGINAAAGLAWDTDATSQQYGRVYLVCVGQGNGTSDDTGIFLSYSMTSGTTWSGQVPVNDDNGQSSKFMPRVAVDPSDGALALSWYDCRPRATSTTTNISTNYTNILSITTNDPNDNPPTNFTTNFETTTNFTYKMSSSDHAVIYGTVSLNGGATFQSNVEVTLDTTNGYYAPNAGNIGFGDYSGLTYYGGIFYPVWADNSGGSSSGGLNPEGPNTNFDIDVAPVVLKGLADVSITSVVTNTTNLPQVGTVIYYYLTVSNAGPAAVTAASVTDIFPSEVLPGRAFPTNGTAATSYVVNGNTLNWTVGALAPKHIATILVQTTAINIGSATNYASVSPGSGVTDLNTNNNATTLVTKIYGADLNVTVSGAPAQIGYGQLPAVTYTVTVSNQGPVTATGVLLSNVLSSNLVLTGVTFPAQYTCSSNASQNSVTFNIGKLTNSQAVTVTVSAWAPLSLDSQGFGPATCTSIALGVIDPANTNNIASGAVQIVAPDLAIGMTASPAFLTVGGTVTYTINVTNLGPVPAFGVTVSDLLPANLTFVTANVPPPGGFILVQNLLTATLGDLAVNQSATITVTAIANAVGQAANTVIAGDDVPEGIPARNITGTVTPVLSPDMALGMTGAPDAILVGQTVTYTITVTNLGPVPATGVVVTHALPPSLSFVGATAPSGATYSVGEGVAPGTPSLAADQEFAAGDWPEAVALGDINGDGLLDIVVANEYENTVSVLLNTTPPGATTPTFAPQQKFILFDFYANSLALADLTRDGKLDIIVGYEEDDVVSVLQNTTVTGSATASFATRLDFNTEGTNGYGAMVAVGDINGDGYPDIVATDWGMDTVSVLLNTYGITNKTGGGTNGGGRGGGSGGGGGGGGTVTNTPKLGFTAAQTFATGFEPWTPTLGDVNNDGKLDIVVPNLEDETVSVLLNTTTNGSTNASFATQQVFPTGGFPIGVALGDLTGDGLLDIVTANYDSDAVSFLLNTTTASGLSFAPNVDLAAGEWPWSVHVADLNSDGKPEIMAANYLGDTVSVWMNTTPAGTTTPSFAARQDFTAGLYPQGMAVGDINGDGLPDIAVANAGSNTVSVLLNTTTNTLEQLVTFNLGSLAVGHTATVTVTASAVSAGLATVSAAVSDSLVDNNLSNNSAVVVTTISPQPPPFSGLTVVPGITGVFITWYTPFNSTGQVAYGLTAPSSLSSVNPTPTNYHVVLLTGLVPNTNYVFEVLSTTAGVLATTNGAFSTSSSIIMGTTDASYSGLGWLTSGAANGIFGYNYRFVPGVRGGETAATAYMPNILVPGLYDVSIWYPDNVGTFSSNTPMVINGATNALVLNVNQTINGGSWQPLARGMFFAAGITGNLTINNNSGSTATSVVANGARWDYNLSQDAPANGSVPAWWADFYFGGPVSGTADPHGVGYSNFAEYVLGLDPTSASGQLQFMVTPGPSTNVTVAFSPWLGGRVYQLQRATNLANPSWVTLTNLPAQDPVSGAGFFTVGQGPGAAVFYRLSASLSATQ